MKSTELRIGNWVKSLDIEYSVISIDQKGNVKGMDVLATEDGNTTFNLDKTIQPIPLTDDILLKCGFDNNPNWLGRFDGTTHVLDLGYLFFAKGMMSIEGVTLFDNSSRSTGIHIKNLHHLQNLYFALTGNELEINI